MVDGLLRDELDTATSFILCGARGYILGKVSNPSAVVEFGKEYEVAGRVGGADEGGDAGGGGLGAKGAQVDGGDEGAEAGEDGGVGGRGVGGEAVGG